MHGRGRKEIFGRARELRQEATSCERQLWDLLRNRQLLGLKFRRQAPVYGFVCDFFCTELQLAIELDGLVHEEVNQEARDRHRDAIFAGHGITVLRIPNQALTQDSKATLAKIEAIAHHLKAGGGSPLPSRERGQG